MKIQASQKKLHIQNDLRALHGTFMSAQTVPGLMNFLVGGGKVAPILVIDDEDGMFTILDGHHRAEAFLKLWKADNDESGLWDYIPAVVVTKDEVAVLEAEMGCDWTNFELTDYVLVGEKTYTELL